MRAARLNEGLIEARLELARQHSLGPTLAAKKGALAPCSWASEESQIESDEHQHNANIRHQPFPESISEERNIQTHNDRYHCDEVKRDSDLFAHFSLHGLYCKGRNEFPANGLCFWSVLQPAGSEGGHPTAPANGCCRLSILLYVDCALMRERFEPKEPVIAAHATLIDATERQLAFQVMGEKSVDGHAAR